MAASTSGAIKAYLEGPTAMGGAALGINVYRDQAPANQARPYLTVSEAVSIVPETLEDGAASTVREHATVDIWMDWKNRTTGALLESYTLPSLVAKALQGTRLLASGSGAPPTTVYSVIVRSVGPRLVEQETLIVHVPVWIEVWRAA